MKKEDYIILLIDDEEEILKLLADFISRKGYQVDTALTGTEAIEKLNSHIYDLVVIDLHLPDMGGIEIVKWINANAPDTISIILSGYATIESTLEVISLGAFDYLVKPVQLAKLNIVVENGLHRREMLLQNKKLISDLQIAKKNLEARVRKRTRELRKSQERFRSLYDNAPDVYYTVDTNGVIINCNKMACEFFGYSKKGLSGKHLLDLYTSENFELISSMVPTEDGEGGSVRHQEVQVKQADGTVREVEINTNLLWDENGKVVGALTLQRDITERKKTEKEKDRLLNKLHELNSQLEELAVTDGLTDLYNHRFFMESLSREFSRAHRAGVPLACLMADIDDFKMFNDTYGHQKGDEILAEVGRILKNSRRGSDIVARYGGEEFVLLLPETDLKRALRLGEKLRKNVEKASVKDHVGGNLKVTISIGAYSFENNNIQDCHELVSRVDQALYLAKRSGKNKVCTLEDRGSGKPEPGSKTKARPVKRKQA
ncbi:MAG: diguanylate cyclase [Gemmatimonadota bacterium]|nr:diguanylate cyclase [Gemmatimonadota bacterium]